MERYDVKTVRRELYRAGAEGFAEVDVPPLQYLAIEGEGNPNTSTGYAAAVQALYAVAYTLKFASRRDHGRDLVVAPLEGLWRADDPGAFRRRDKDHWRWTMLIHQPEWITGEDVEAATQSVAAKADADALDRLHLTTLHEGRCLQILHVGAYDDEGPVLELLHDEVMPSRGLTWNGDHHEIYLGDPRRSAPERLRTILRQPVRGQETSLATASTSERSFQRWKDARSRPARPDTLMPAATRRARSSPSASGQVTIA